MKIGRTSAENRSYYYDCLDCGKNHGIERVKEMIASASGMQNMLRNVHFPATVCRIIKKGTVSYKVIKMRMNSEQNEPSSC